MAHNSPITGQRSAPSIRAIVVAKRPKTPKWASLSNDNQGGPTPGTALTDSQVITAVNNTGQKIWRCARPVICSTFGDDGSVMPALISIPVSYTHLRAHE